jgi:hypothetical protein
VLLKRGGFASDLKTGKGNIRARAKKNSQTPSKCIPL